MGLFDAQITGFRGLVEGWEANGRLRTLDVAEGAGWKRGESLILQEDCGLELGNPGTASISFMMWAEEASVERDAVRLLGPDAPELGGGSVPFGQVVIVGGDFPDEYEAFRDLRDAAYGVHIEGFMPRSLPSRQTTWCRVSREAMDKGFSLGHLGAALIGDVGGVENVSGVEVLFITGSVEDVRSLAPVADGARRVVDALLKMYTEKKYDCKTCEYRDVCESVMELKDIRKKLTGERA